MSGVNDIRSTFLNFFAENGHEIVSSLHWCRATTRR
jgi:alanyl-tRNA synthetase